MNAPLLEVRNVTMRFGGIVANRNVSFAVEPGRVTALIGPNGAGKTTMFNCITGFYRASEGQILLNGPEGPQDIGTLITRPVTGGSHLDLARKWKQAIYYDQQGTLTDKLRIRQVPALVSQEGSRLRIDEIR